VLGVGVGELHQPREQRARIVRRRLGQSSSPDSCLHCLVCCSSLALVAAATTLQPLLLHASTSTH
jgi:hypothetical protein